MVLERIVTERRRLEGNLAALDAEEMVIPGVVGEWSVKDILAHLMDWEQRFLGWYETSRRGEEPELPAPGIGWGELNRLNHQIFEKHRGRSLADVLDAFGKSYRQVVRTVQAMSEVEMFAAGQYAWLGDGNLVRYILANTANHYRWAKQQLRLWLMG